MGKKTLYTVSNAHLDTQWNWTIRDTIRDCIKRTLEQNFALLEKYPSYVFNFEGAFRYRLAKEYYPALYEKLREYVAAGRWCFAGGAWDAADVNCPSSEAIMRNLLLGNGFIEEEFGPEAMSKDVFLPDCFGFRYSLPSIASHMGLIGFSTQKLTWGVGSPVYHPKEGCVTMPMPGGDLPRLDLCRWRGPDGGELICCFDGEDYTYNFDRSPDQPIARREEYLKRIEHNAVHSGVPYRSMYYGAGDDGGSPSDGGVRMLEEAISDPDALYDVKMARSYDLFLDLTEEERKRIPVYEGGLLIPHGFGAMVSNTISKRWNRKCELLADAAEKASSIAACLGAEYPKERLKEAWRTFLWHQFHDDLTGTSIGDAYVFSYNDYVIAQNVFASELTSAVTAISRHFATDSVKGVPVIVFSPTSHPRTEPITLEWKTDAPFASVYDACGIELPTQSKRDGDKLIVTFVASFGALSCQLFDLRASSAPCAIATGLSVTENRLENDRYLVEIDGMGDVCRIYDKKACREVLSSPIRFELMPDTVSSPLPSWEYNYEDFSKPFETVNATPEIEIASSGPATVSLKIRRRFRNSTYAQTVTLYAGGQRVDFDNQIEWQEQATMLRVAVPSAVKNREAEFDLGLGVDKWQSSTDNYPYYQYLVHQWADLTDADGSFGVSLINDCKYSMDKPDESTLRLTLIRTPAGAFKAKSSQDYQDWGTNLFHFSLTSHLGCRNGVAAEAEAVNQPPSAFYAAKHEGRRTEASLLSLSHGEHLVRCGKKEEKGERLVVRIQETSGVAAKDARIRFSSKILSACEANGYETEIGAVRIERENELVYDLAPYGVKTFLVDLAPREEKQSVKQTVIALPYHTKVTTDHATLGKHSLTKGISIPTELFPKSVTAGGVYFALGPSDGNHALVCSGQVLTVPRGTKRISLLAASTNGDKKAIFEIGGKAKEITVQDALETVGAWNLHICNLYCKIKRDEVGYTFTHTHDESGDRPYLYANLFKYDLGLDGETEIRLPSDPDIVLMAATAEAEDAVLPAMPLYDRVEEKEEIKRHLEVIGAKGSGVYPEGRTVLLQVPFMENGAIIDHWEGVEKTNFDQTRAVLTMKDADRTVRLHRRYLGKNLTEQAFVRASSVALGSKAIWAQGYENNEHGWTSDVEEGGVSSIEYDLKQEYPIHTWMVIHDGARGRMERNTVDFRLECRTEDGEYQTVDSVSDNKDWKTVRGIEPITARFVRLVVTKASNHGDKHARIYQFAVFGEE